MFAGHQAINDLVRCDNIHTDMQFDLIRSLIYSRLLATDGSKVNVTAQVR